MKTKTKTIRISELVKLRQNWKKQINDLNDGTNWACNNRICKLSRADKAEGIQGCLIDLSYLLKHVPTRP